MRLNVGRGILPLGKQIDRVSLSAITSRPAGSIQILVGLLVLGIRLVNVASSVNASADCVVAAAKFGLSRTIRPGALYKNK